MTINLNYRYNNNYMFNYFMTKNLPALAKKNNTIL